MPRFPAQPLATLNCAIDWSSDRGMSAIPWPCLTLHTTFLPRLDGFSRKYAQLTETSRLEEVRYFIVCRGRSAAAPATDLIKYDVCAEKTKNYGSDDTKNVVKLAPELLGK